MKHNSLFITLTVTEEFSKNVYFLHKYLRYTNEICFYQLTRKYSKMVYEILESSQDSAAVFQEIMSQMKFKLL